MNAPAFDQKPSSSRPATSGSRSARGWNDHSSQIRAWLRTATDAMLDMAGIGPGARVLDVAAGAGDQTLDIAERVGSEGHVLATDLSAAILEFAQGKRAARRASTTWRRTWPTARASRSTEASFDAAVCRLGLMFFPDPLRGLREMHRALKPGGGVCTMVFSRPKRTLASRS